MIISHVSAKSGRTRRASSISVPIFCSSLKAGKMTVRLAHFCGRSSSLGQRGSFFCSRYGESWPRPREPRAGATFEEARRGFTREGSIIDHQVKPRERVCEAEEDTGGAIIASPAKNRN